MTADEVLAVIRGSGKPHYVYVLHKPDGVPFYVGIGTGRRILDHAIVARRKTAPDSHKIRTIRAIWRTGLEIDYRIAGSFSDWADAAAAEAALIASIGRRDIHTGPLSNVTAGGDGATGLSPERLASRSEKMRAVWAKRDKKAAMAHLHNPAVKAKEIAGKTGKKRGPYNWVNKPGPKAEARARLSAALKADPLSRRPGIADKIARANRGKTWKIDPGTGKRAYQNQTGE